MYRIIILLLFVNAQATIQLGRIQNANLALNSSSINSTYIKMSNITCDQCLCRMLAMNNLTATLACQQKLMTCQFLFWNATSQLQTDQTSTVYFQTIPTFLVATEDQQLTTVLTSTQATVTSTFVPVSLINPGAELGSLYPWTPSSSTAPSLDNGTTNSGNTSPHSGRFDFYGDTGGGTLTQRVSLTNSFSTSQLDSGSLHVFVSFWELSVSATPPDTALVYLIFRSATNSSLFNATTIAKGCTTAWCQTTANWSLPIGTRTIDYVMKFILNFGTHSDARIDDNVLSIA